MKARSVFYVVAVTLLLGGLLAGGFWLPHHRRAVATQDYWLHLLEFTTNTNHLEENLKPNVPDDQAQAIFQQFRANRNMFARQPVRDVDSDAITLATKALARVDQQISIGEAVLAHLHDRRIVTKQSHSFGNHFEALVRGLLLDSKAFTKKWDAKEQQLNSRLEELKRRIDDMKATEASFRSHEVETRARLSKRYNRSFPAIEIKS